MKTVQQNTEVHMSYVCLYKPHNQDVMNKHPQLKYYYVNQDKLNGFPLCYSSHNYWCFDRAVMHSGAMPSGSFFHPFIVKLKAAETAEREPRQKQLPDLFKAAGGPSERDSGSNAERSLLGVEAPVNPAEEPEEKDPPQVDQPCRALLDQYPEPHDERLQKVAERLHDWADTCISWSQMIPDHNLSLPLRELIEELHVELTETEVILDKASTRYNIQQEEVLALEIQATLRARYQRLKLQVENWGLVGDDRWWCMAFGENPLTNAEMTRHVAQPREFR